MSITLWQHLTDRVHAMADAAFADVNTLDDWKQLRPQRLKQYMRSLGLDPLPPRCELKVTDYGSFSGEGYRARKVGFQILPDCWSSACIYYPAPLPTAAKLPGVLYVCGHAEIGTWYYQSHGMMWARRGYVCLIVDTIEQNDNPGEHHGNSNGQFEAWLSMGYTPTGGETWNSIRALDVLEADEHVDPDRLAVTGVSGGGSLSFHTAVADSRIKAVSTLCGVSGAVDAIAKRHVMHNCCCFYPHNVDQLDTAEMAALLAPRAALFCYAEQDVLFSLPQVREVIERTRKVYKLYGQEDRLQLVTCAGVHGDQPPFDEATSRCFDQYVAGDERPLVTRGTPDLHESVISVFNGQPPEPNHVDLLPQLLSPRGTIPLPTDTQGWPAIRAAAVAALREQVFLRHAQPTRDALMTLDGDWNWGGSGDGTPVRSYHGSIDGIDISMHTITPTENPNRVLLGVGGAGETWMHVVCHLRTSIDLSAAVCVGFESRLSGSNAPAEGVDFLPHGSRLESMRSIHLRAMAVTGQTPVMMMMRDVVVAVDTLLALPQTAASEIYLHGKADAGVACLYHAVLDERVAGVFVEDMPATHLQGAPIIGILRVMDLPHAVGLMAPRKIALITPGHRNWTWPDRSYGRLECRKRFVVADHLREATERLFAE